MELLLSLTSSRTSQFVVVIHRHRQTSLSCRRSFGLQDRANLVPENIFFSSKSIHKTCFEVVTTSLFKGCQCFEAIFLTSELNFDRSKFIMCPLQNPAGFCTGPVSAPTFFTAQRNLSEVVKADTKIPVNLHISHIA